MSRSSDHLAVRQALPADAARIADLMTQLGYPATSRDITDRLAYWLPDPMSLILVAENGGRVIGCLSLHAIPYLERTGRWALGGPLARIEAKIDRRRRRRTARQRR
jgi:predicted N-acetyltransferase YhbS